MNLSIIIPARFASSRFPGKPLTKIAGIPMIERVWLNAVKAIDKKNVYVATDSNKIKKFCLSKGIQVILTSKQCKTGTDRIVEAAQYLELDYVINLQGDEPVVDPRNIKKIIKYAQLNKPDAFNCMTKITNITDYKNLNVPKVIFDKYKNLTYISRAAIPSNKTNKYFVAFKQVSIYGYSKKIINFLSNNKNKTFFEKIEDIEIIRLLENNIRVQMLELKTDSVAVDVKSDIKKVESFLKKNNLP